MSRIIRLCALIAALAVCLTGCMKRPASVVNGDGISLPEPPAYASDAMSGESASQGAIPLTLFYPAQDGLSLSQITRNVRLEPGEHVVSRLLKELCNEDPGAGANRMHSDLLRQTGYESACGIVTLHLPVDADANLSGQDFYTFCVSVANTLLSSGEIAAVSFLTGDQAASVAGLPLGVFTECVQNPGSEYPRMTAEAERAAADPSSPVSRGGILYYPSNDGRFLLPEICTFNFVPENPAQSIIDALTRPSQRSCCIGAVPSNLDLFALPPQRTVTPEGEQIAELCFTSVLSNYLAFAGIQPWQFFGSVVLSLCSCNPEISGVRIRMEDETVQSCEICGQSVAFKDGILRRRDFSGRIGSSAVLTVTDASGALKRREYAISRADAGSAAGILSAMIDADPENGIFPGGVRPSDILGAAVRDGIASVNLSGFFYAECQSFSAARERRLIYAMINSICELPGIGAVRFLVEGRQIDSLSGSICLNTPLLPDPGIIADEAD